MMEGFTGTFHVVRLILRLDRIKLSLWVLGVAGIIAITPLTLRSITETEATNQGVTPEAVLAQQATLVGTNAASVALQGPADALETFGGRYAFEIGAFTFAIVGLMNVLLIARHTRTEEESGRAELVRAAAVGPWSAIAAVGLVAVVANLILSATTGVAFIADGLATWPSILFGSSIGICGLVFAATTLVSVQIFEYGRAATGAAIGAIAIAFAIRAVGDVQDNGLSLLSPIGWSQAVNAFGQTTVWPLGLSLLAIAISVGLAIVLVLRRDVGRGLIDQRPGPPTAGRSLLSPLGLAWRLQRSTLAWWAIGIAFMGATYGSVISALNDFIEENEVMRDMFEALGMSSDALREGFITVILSMIALIAGAGVIQSMLRPRGEEVAGRAEPVLATSLSRPAWLGSHLLLTMLAAPAFMVIAAVALIVSDALVAGEMIGLGDTIVAGLLRVPALWATAGIGVLLYGWARRFTLGVWAVFCLALFIFLFGDVLKLPDYAMNLSPIRHVTHAPGGDQGWLAIAVLIAIGSATTFGGLALFSRRDVG